MWEFYSDGLHVIDLPSIPNTLLSLGGIIQYYFRSGLAGSRQPRRKPKIPKMLLSMTGFGRAEAQWEDKTISVELRSLNSKASDLKIRVPQRYREKEVFLRNIVMTAAKRGKIELSVDVMAAEGAADYSINKSLFRGYFKDLKDLSDELGLPDSDFIGGILRIPGVVDVPKEGMPDAEWQALESATEKALADLYSFRKQEGRAMENDFRQHIRLIQQHLTDVEPFEQERVGKARARIRQNLEDLISNREIIDQNRLEQEMIYYLEKYDLNEEKVRLRQHCEYFLEQLDSGEELKGRKLMFIGQEMGREINTIGSKANSASIQKLVVKMKDELEKIKEQAANVL